LLYGISVVVASRPVFVVFVVDRFEVVTSAELNDADVSAAAISKYRSLSWRGPMLAGAHFPADTKERNDLLFSAAIAGKDLELMPKYYLPYDSVVKQVQGKSKPLQALVDSHPEVKSVLISRFGSLSAAETLRWLPVHQHYGFWTALIDQEGYPVEYLPIDPY
jgi:hypothetical protein